MSIITVNYNGKQFNRAMIQSLLAQDYQDFELIFVDNQSSDGSLEEVEETFRDEIKNKKIIIVKSATNTGFCGGNNLGARHVHAEAKYICLLNNDVTVPKNRLSELVKPLEGDAQIGAVESLILDAGHEKQLTHDYLVEHKSFISNYLGETATAKTTPEEIRS